MIQIEPLIGIQELSNQLGWNRYTIYKRMREKTFPKGVKLKGRRMFKPQQIVKHFNDIGIQIEFITSNKEFHVTKRIEK